MSAEPERIDRYEIHGKLGAGGFGTVYRARHVVLGTEVALKVLSPEHIKEPGMVERFLREAQTAAGIGNPHIVGVSDAGVTSQGMPFLAMELLEGEDLEVRIKRQGALPLLEAIDIMLQLLEGLGAAHAARIVHRDLKPGNVFLTRGPDGRPWVKLLDFGISKVFEPGRVASLTQTGAVLGTPAYMAPEQLHDTRGVDHRADLYAAGAILFEALTGRLPYLSETFADLMARVQGRAPTRLDVVLPSAPPRLVAIADRALAPDPALRFHSAAEMHDELCEVRQFLGGTPAGFPSYALPAMAPIPGTGGPAPSPYTPPPFTPSPAPVSAPSGMRYLAQGPTPAPSWGPSQPPSVASGGFPPNAMTPHPLAEPRGSGRSRGLWLGLGAAGLLLPLACVGAAVATFALSDDEVEPAPPVPSDLPPPPSDPIGAIQPLPIAAPPPAPPAPPPPSDGPPVAAPIPAGADPCAVPLHIDVECDRNFDEHIPLACELSRGREMILLGAYAPQRSDNRVTVDIARTAAPIVLVLSSYAAIDWELRLAEGARVEEIHLVGRGSSRVASGTPPGVQVRHGGGYPIMGWSWEGMSSTWSGRATADAAERDTRTVLRAYVGCYNPTRYFVGQSAPAP